MQAPLQRPAGSAETPGMVEGPGDRVGSARATPRDPLATHREREKAMVFGFLLFMTAGVLTGLLLGLLFVTGE